MELLVLTQNGCKPCHALKMALTAEDVDFTEVNVSDEPEYIDKYNILATPTTVVLDEAEEVDTIITDTNIPKILDIAKNL